MSEGKPPRVELAKAVGRQAMKRAAEQYETAEDPELREQLAASLWEGFRRGWTDKPPGWDEEPPRRTCPSCGGFGRDPSPHLREHEREDCPVCHGRGVL